MEAFEREISECGTPTVVTLVAQLARLQLEDSADLDSFFIRGQELLTRLQEAGEAVSETLFNGLVLNGLQMGYESFVIQESFNPATSMRSWTLCPFNQWSESQRRGFQSGGQRLCEDQHTLKQRGIPMRTQKCSVCAGLFFKPPISLKMHGVGT